MAVREGALADVERDTGPLEQLVELVADVGPQPPWAGGQPVDRGQRIRIARERGVVRQRAQRAEGMLDVDPIGEVDPEREAGVGIEPRRDDLHPAHVAAGGVAAIPLYLKETSSFLIGRYANPETIVKANKIIQAEISPISDVRGSANYKRLLLRQLFTAHFHELFGVGRDIINI